MRVLHVLHNSLPHISGYSIRSNYIMSLQRELGIDTVAVTSAQQPDNDAPRQIIEDTEYRRTPSQPGRPPLLREAGLMFALGRSVAAAVREWKPDLIHAHSPVLVGLPALHAARKHGLPLVYEVRDLWENASVDRGKFKADSPQYRAARELETILFRRADAVVTICDQLAETISPRLGKHVALHVVGNGVEVSEFTPTGPDPAVIARWKLRGKRVIGYLGAFQPYEGLEVLIAAMPQLIARMPQAHLLITGSGDVEEELKRQVSSLGVGDSVTFTGRVPHAEVKGLYTVAEVMVYPRTLTRTTALTTPLKPLEAMAMGRPVIVSDVPAMLELVKPGETGLVFRAGDTADLAQRCLQVLDNPTLQAQMCKQARQWVVEHRQWPALVGKYPAIYRSVLPRS